MSATLRLAEPRDVEAMVALSEAFRAGLESISPRFWRKAPDSAERQASWFRLLLTLDDTLALVAEREAGLEGFVVGRLAPAPPVYAPGGPVCLIDDFCLAEDASWEGLGARLLRAVEEAARERGAVLSVVVCPREGGAKRSLLAAQGFTPTSEWHVRPL